MQIDKSQIIDMLKNQGKNDQADQAASDLPDKVDLDQYGDVLQKFGVDPKDLMGKLGGLGGLGG